MRAVAALIMSCGSALITCDHLPLSPLVRMASGGVTRCATTIRDYRIW